MSQETGGVIISDETKNENTRNAPVCRVGGGAPVENVFGVRFVVGYLPWGESRPAERPRGGLH